MTQVAHAGRKHSRIGPSAAHRWLECPASVQRSEGVGNESTVFAQEGSAAHTLAEHVMVTRVDPWTLLGGVVDLQANGADAVRAPGTFNIAPDDWHVFEITEEMIEAVELYRDTLLPLIEEGDVHEYECRLDMRHVHPDLFGTGDALIYKPQDKHLIVGDFKYGRGVAVDVTDNEQLLTYGVGALARFGVENVDMLTLIIIQPRSYHVHGPVRRQALSVIDLMLFESHLGERAALTDDPNAPAVAGPHCRFCPVAWGCKDLRRYIFEKIGIGKRAMKHLTDQDMPDVRNMSLDDIGAVLRESTIIEAWLKRVAQHGHNLAVNGQIPTGMKLVDKRAYRKFTDAAAVESTLAALGYDDTDYLTEPKLRTPKQIETAIGKKEFTNLLGHLVKKDPSGVVLVPIEDHRSSVKLDKSDSFGAVEDE